MKTRISLQRYIILCVDSSVFPDGRHFWAEKNIHGLLIT
jgi:hypothetical protein